MFTSAIKSVNSSASVNAGASSKNINKGYCGGGSSGTFWERLTGQK